MLWKQLQQLRFQDRGLALQNWFPIVKAKKFQWKRIEKEAVAEGPVFISRNDYIAEGPILLSRKQFTSILLPEHKKISYSNSRTYKIY